MEEAVGLDVKAHPVSLGTLAPFGEAKGAEIVGLWRPLGGKGAEVVPSGDPIRGVRELLTVERPDQRPLEGPAKGEAAASSRPMS